MSKQNAEKGEPIGKLVKKEKPTTTTNICLFLVCGIVSLSALSEIYLTISFLISYALSTILTQICFFNMSSVISASQLTCY